jgi:transcriptional regulator with GAF, ATPase, and Fis domain
MEEGGHNKLSLTVKVGEGLQTIRDEAEKNLIIQVLRDNSFNVYKSAKVLGVKRESLYYFMKKFGLERERD